MKTNKILHIFIIVLVLLQSLVYPWISILPAPPGVHAAESPPEEATLSASTPAPSPLEPNSLDQILNQTLSTSTQSAETPRPEAIPESTPSASPEAIPETPISTPSATLEPQPSPSPSSQILPTISEPTPTIAPSPSPKNSDIPKVSPPEIKIPETVPTLDPFDIRLSYPFVGNRDISYGFGLHSQSDFISRMQSLFGVDAHDGIDFAMPDGTEIFAADSGTIISAGRGLYGTTIQIQHSWGTSYYGHLSSTIILSGDKVEKGQLIGYSGSTGIVTGPHLHFGIRPNKPNLQNGFHGLIDPMPYLLGKTVVESPKVASNLKIGPKARNRQVLRLKLDNYKSAVNPLGASISTKTGSSPKLPIEQLSQNKLKLVSSFKLKNSSAADSSLEPIELTLGDTVPSDFKVASLSLKRPSSLDIPEVELTPDATNNSEFSPSDKSDLTPGKYTLLLKSETGDVLGTNDFTWGVLTLNTDKAVYSQGESGYLQIGALNDLGHTLCNANLLLTVTTPSNSTTSLSTEDGSLSKSQTCGADNVTDNPDYFTNYLFTENGSYLLELTNVDNNYSISNTVTVADNQPFIIERVSATRINPFKSEYEMNIKVTANENFAGIVSEKVPSDFTITSGQTDWDLNLKSNESVTLSYKYQAPLVSPEIFTLGPLTVGSYIEPRVWSIASDVACNATTTGNWATPGTWTGCTGGGVPANGDDVTINANVVVTAAANATINSITIANPAATGANGVTVATGVTLTVTANVAYTNNTGALNQTITLQGTGIMNVGTTFDTGTPSSTGLAQVVTTSGTNCTSCQLNVTGAVTVNNSSAATAGKGIIAMTTGATNVFSAGSLTIAGGTTGTAIATVSTATGTITINGATTFSGTAAKTLLNVTGAGTLNLYGNLGSGGTVTLAATSTTVAQATLSVGATYTFGNFTIAAGTTTWSAAQTVAGSWTNNSSTTALTAGGFATTFSGASKTIGGSFLTPFAGIIIAAASTVTLNTSCTATTLVFNANGASQSSSLTHASGIDLTLSSTVTLTQASSATGSPTAAWNINAGTATANGRISTTGTSTTARITKIVITTGTLNAYGGLTFTGTTATNKIIDMSGGAGNLNLKNTLVASNTAATLTSSTTSVFCWCDTTARTITGGGTTFWLAGAYSNLKINSTGGATLAIAATATNITGDIIVGDGTTAAVFKNGGFAMTGNTKNFTVNANATFEMSGTSTYPTGYTMSFNATSTVNYRQTTTPLAVASATYGNLGLLPAGTATYNLPAGTLTVAGTLTCGNATNAATCSANANSTTLDIQTSLLIAASSTFVAHASNPFYIADDFTNNGTFTHSSGTTTLDGTITQVINGSSTTTFNNLTVTNTTAAITPTVNFNVAGTLNMNGSATVMTPSAAVVVNSAGAAGVITGTGTVKVTRTAATADYSSQYKFTTNTLTNLTVDYNGAGQILSNLTYSALTVSGSISTGTNTATVTGAFTVTGTFTPTAGTITLNNGSSIINSGTMTAFNLTTDTSATVTSSSSFTVAGAFTIGSSSSYTSSAGTITLNNGASIVSSGTPTFSSLTTASSATVSSAGSFAVTGTFTIGSSSVFTPSAADIISGAGTLTGTGTAQVTRTAATADFSSQYTITTKTLTNLTIDYAGTGEVLSNLTYGGLKVSGSIATGANSATVTGVFTTSGTFTPSSGTMTFNNGSSIVNSGTLTFVNVTVAGSAAVSTASSFTVAGNWASTGSFAASAGTITFTGADSSTQTFTGDNTFYNFTATTTANSAGRTLQFAGNSTNTVLGTWTITGASGKAITLQSSDTNRWFINPAVAAVTYVATSKSTNIGGAICATFSIDSGLNTSWSIAPETTCTLLQVASTADTTTGSGTYVGMNNMAITPGTGDYLVQFNTSIQKSAGTDSQYVSLFVAGAQVTHTERFIEGESSYDSGDIAVIPVSIQAYVAGVTGSDVVEVRWKTTSGNPIAHERTLTVQKVTSSDMSQATATDSPTTASTTYTQLTSMTLTPGAGDYIAYFSSSVENTTTSDIDVSIFVAGTQVAHSERTYYTEGSFPATTAPISTQAYISGVGASDTVEVRWRTSAGTATALQRTLTVQKVSSANISQATATSTATTTSTTDTQITSMTLTPGAGDYIAYFSTSIKNTADVAGSTQNLSIYVNSIQVAHSERQIFTEESYDGGNIDSFVVSTQSYITGVGAGEVVEVKYRTSTGTESSYERTLTLMKITNPSSSGIAGTANGNDGATVKVAVNGSAQAQTGTIASGNWSITGVSLATDDIITTWVDNVADSLESTAVTKYAGGGVTNMVLDTNVISVGSNQDTNLTLSNLNLFDCTQDEDVMYQAGNSQLNTEGNSCSGAVNNSYAAEKIEILSGNTLTVGTTETLNAYDLTITGTLTSGGNSIYNISHDWTNSGTFNKSTSTVNLSGDISSTQTLAGSNNFNNLSTLNTGWYNSSWSYRQKITIDHSKVGADQIDFPVYVNLANLPSGFHTHVNQTDARDIRVTKADGTTELPREVVFYTAASDTGELHFKYTGTLSSTVDTDVYIYYGNAGASDYAVNSTYGAQNVWDNNYAGVWHLQESSGTRYDSTSNDNDLSVTNTVGNSTSGALGTTASFTTAGYLSRANASLATGFPSKSGETTTSFTASFWMKATTLPFGDWLGKSNGNGWGFYDNAGGNAMYGFYHTGASNTTSNTPASSITTGSWYQFSYTHNASTDVDDIYLNGSQSGTDPGRTGDPDSETSSFMIGGTDAFPSEADGLIDEVRVSKSSRSATWTSTEYNNQSSSQTFYYMNDGESSNGNRTISFTAGTTQTVTGTWTVTGVSGSPVILGSTSSSPWTIKPSNSSINYATVSKSINIGSSICATNSTNNGNNESWSFASSSTCNIREVGSNVNTTTTNTSYELLENMSITPGAGNYMVNFNTSIKKSVGSSIQLISIFVGGVQVAHTERILDADSSLDTGDIAVNPMAIQAYVAGVGSSDAIEIRWNTSAGTATALERTLIIESVTASDMSQATASTATTTTSTSDVQLTSMTLTPGAGNYMAYFSSSVKNNTIDTSNYFSFYVNGVQVAHTERNIFEEESFQDTYYPVITHAYISGVGASDVVGIKWRTSAGTATARERTLTLQKVSSAEMSQTTATSDTTSTSSTDTQINTMTLTPGAGDYLVYFSTTISATDNSGSTQNTSLYAGGSQITNSERQIYTEQSYNSGIIDSFATSSVAYVTNLGASDVIEAKWRTDAGTITGHQRTLTVKKVISHGSAANSFQRKTWYDGTRYWRSYQDTTNSRLTFEYSTNGTTWTEDTSARIDTNTNDFSIQADSSNAYIAYKTGAVANEDNLLTSNLSAYWKMDETTGNTCSNGSADTCDSSGNNLIGTWNNNTTTTTGKFGNGTTFDGTDDYIAVSDPGTGSVLDFSNGSSITFSAWINPTTLPSANTWQTIIHKGENSGSVDNSNYYFQIGNQAGTYVLSLCFMDTTNVIRCWDSGSAALSTGSWQHIALSFTFGTGSSIKAYKNGSLLSTGSGWDTGTGSETVKTNNSDLYIGADHISSIDEEYNGKLDDVRIYSTTVSADDLSALANPGYDIEVRKASSYPGTSFTWSSASVGLNGTTSSDYYQYPVVTQDSNSKIWLGAAKNSSSTYTFNAVRSTSANVITAWDTSSSLDSSANSNKYGTLTPRTSGAVYAAWIDNITIEGKNYNGTSWDGSPVTIATGTSGLTTTLSTLGDSSGNVHLLYIDNGGNTIYRKYISSWGLPNILDSNSGNTYPTLSLNSTDGDMYAFWVRSNNIYYKKGDFLNSGNALSFDGSNDYVNVPYNASLDYATDMTVEFWMNPGATIDTSLSTYKGIISKASSNTDSDNDWVFFWESTEAGKMRFGSYGDNVKTTTDTWTAGTWYHVAVTVNSSNTAYIYVNGVQDNFGGDTTISGNPINGTQNTPLNIGLARVASGDQYWNGKIDDVRIYNTVRSQSQIQADMYSELAGNETNLQAYWKMNAGSGQTVADSTSNAYDGTLGANSSSASDDPTWTSTIPFSNSWDQSATSWKTSGINTGVTTNYSGANQIFGEWSDGTIINWDMLTISSNTAPNSPSSLAQKTVADATISTGSWVSATSIKFTATATDTDNPDTLYLCVEKDDINTAFSNTEDSCGSGVSYTGTGVALSATIASQTDATEYHWQARVKDSAGAYSSWVSYGANSDTTPGATRDYGLDTTAPTGGTVYDGTSVGVDATFSDSSLSALSANWGSFNNNVSGLNKYEYSIGTTVGGTDIKAWTDNTTSTTVTATGLTLHTSLIYYVNVRATDNAGNVSSVISSNGQIVAPSLSFTVSPASITFSNLGPLNSYTDTQTTTLTTSTNAYNGYVVRAFITDYLRNGATTIADFSPGTYASPATWSGSETGFGYTSSDTTIGGSNKFSSGTLYAPFNHTGPGDIVADHTTTVSGSPISNEAFTLTYKVKVPATQAAKSYSGTVVYTATAQY